MSALNAIRVKNLRSLGDTGELPLRRLNLLVGRNSGGKSTFARIMPLIRQSTEVRKRSPVLWYGRLVDFGSFQDSVRDSDSNKEIQFSFRLSLDNSNTIVDSVKSVVVEDSAYDVLAAITLISGRTPGETTVSRLDLTFEGIDCALIFQRGNLISIQVGDLLEIINPALHQQTSFNGLLPSVRTYKLQKVKVRDQEFTLPVTTNAFLGPLARDIVLIAKNNMTIETAEGIADGFRFGTNREILAQLRGLAEGPQRWLTYCKALTEKTTGFERMRNAIIMATLPKLISLVDEAITATAKNVSYLEPLRASAQRYYRRQELAVDELDSRGENVAFFLDNLDAFEKDILDNWLKQNFGISVETESSGGHIAIRLKLKDSQNAVNLADTGFGYSQVLPIALQLWKLTQRDHFRSSSDEHYQKIVVMEQPELHLHPALQAKLGDIFSACISDDKQRIYGNADLRITVETHSPSLVNRIGELISMGTIQPEHVQVILFEKDERSGMTSTRISEFGEDGRLKNWPYGFFDAIDDENEPQGETESELNWGGSN